MPNDGEDEEWSLVEEVVEPPWTKDYDDAERPTRWLQRDTTNWRLISAFYRVMNG